MRKTIIFLSLLISVMVYLNLNASPVGSSNSITSVTSGENWVNYGPSYFYDHDGKRFVKSYDVLVWNLDGTIFAKLDTSYDSGFSRARKTTMADKGYGKFTHVFTLPDSEDTKRYFNYYQ